ncbi:MAG TPA: hypothetical protein VNB90_00535 [Cytophagaceae bacterium]|nr:hypothetical protein [Cytophagaceae bacterium]
MKSQTTLLILSGITLFTIATGACFLWFLKFDGIEFNGDSFTYFSNAKTFLSAVSNGQFPKSTFWPYGFPAVLSSSFLLGDETYESARWINVVLAGLLNSTFAAVMLLFASVRRLSSSHTILLMLAAGLFPVGHDIFLKYQLLIMSDVLAALFSMLTLFCCWRWRAYGRWYNAALAGIFLGFAGCTRYVHLLTSVAAFSIFISGLKKENIRSTLLALLVFGAFTLLAFAPQLSITLQDTSSTVGHSLLKDWSLQNFFLSTHESADGHQQGKVPSLIYYFALPFRFECFTPLGLILAMLGIRFAIRELPLWCWLPLMVWYFSFYFFHSGIPIENSRHAFPLFLPIVLWIALGLLECWLLWPRHFIHIVIFTFMLWLGAFMLSVQSAEKLVHTKNELKATAQILSRTVPPGSRVISTSLCAVYHAYPETVVPISIYSIPLEQTKNLFQEKTPVYMAIDEKRFIPQWTNYPPGKNYYWIKNYYTCQYKFVLGDYTVYEIKEKN